MGAFFLCVRERERESADVLGRGLASLRAQGFAQPTRITTTGFDIVAFPKYRGGSVQLAKRDDDNFALLTGTSIFEHGVGEQAAKHFLEDFQFEAPAWDEIHGHYCAIVCRRGRLRLFVDRLGTYKVYADRARSVVSSSFLAVCDAIGRLEIDSQAVYEYAFLGGT
ncbi:MAG TPA: hypothetical protein VD788_16640, partial [Candidatus Polarisedimenticolaceae bacterium]|nr:hypothetical protein [Candidatus Polarisedimenticolaceae bacterium]